MFMDVCTCYTAIALLLAPQLVEIMPNMDQLPQMLGPPYSIDDDDQGQQPPAAAANDVSTADATASSMDVDHYTAEVGPGSSDQGGRTFEQLLDIVQVGGKLQSLVEGSN